MVSIYKSCYTPNVKATETIFNIGDKVNNETKNYSK